jgi:hypothetical protein
MSDDFAANDPNRPAAMVRCGITAWKELDPALCLNADQRE